MNLKIVQNLHCTVHLQWAIYNIQNWNIIYNICNIWYTIYVIYDKQNWNTIYNIWIYDIQYMYNIQHIIYEQYTNCNIWYWI